jgi:predicted O-methyltransferase YrrM
MNITNDTVTEYLESLYHPVNEELGKLREIADKHNVPIILKDSETFLLNMLRMKKPKRILEIGTAIGYSAICFAFACPDAEIVTLERSEKMAQYAEVNVNKFELSDRIRIIKGDALESLERLREEIKDTDQNGFDFIFIDAAKSFYKKFWEACIPMCRNEAVILSDNVLLKGRTASDEFITERRQKTSVRHMREYLKAITELDGADTAVIAVGDGIAVSVLK